MIATPLCRSCQTPAAPARRRTQIIPFLITLATVALAGASRLGDVGRVYGSAVDARRNRARLCRDDGAGGRRAHRRAARRRQQIRSQGRSADGDRPDQLHDRRQPSRGGGAAGAGERAEHRRANDCPAGADQRQPGTAGSGAGGARVRTAAGGALPDPGERRLWHRSECAAVHVAAASAGGRGEDCGGKPQLWRSGRSSR